MKALITVAPVEFKDGFVIIPCGRAPLYRAEVDIKNVAELWKQLDTIRFALREDGQIFIKPLTRKINGFDAFKRTNHNLFYTTREQQP